jgi:predicted RNase H-like nuclease
MALPTSRLALRAPPIASSQWVAGVDGCRGGWLVILCSLAHGTDMRLGVTSRVCADFKAVLALPENPVAIAVDMPIGLLERSVPGGRECDRAARALLGRPRSSSVFTPPTRPGLAAMTYAEAPALNGAGMSKESFNILPKIRELDAALSVHDQQRVFEVHPELAFARLACAPLRHNKKTLEGRRERIRLLKRVFAASFQDPIRMRKTHSLRHVALDDIADAYVLAYAACCIRGGAARRVPEAEPPVDARGLRMEIWY